MCGCGRSGEEGHGRGQGHSDELNAKGIRTRISLEGHIGVSVCVLIGLSCSDPLSMIGNRMRRMPERETIGWPVRRAMPDRGCSMLQQISWACAVAFSAPALGGVVAYSNWEPTDPGPGLVFRLSADSAAFPDEAGFNFLSGTTGGLKSVAIAAAPFVAPTGQSVSLSVWSTDAQGTPITQLATSEMFLSRMGSGSITNLYEFEFDGSATLSAGTTYSLVMRVLGATGGASWGGTSSVAETIVYRSDEGGWTVQPPSVANATMTAHIVVTPVPHTLAALGAAGLCVARRRRERMKG